MHTAPPLRCASGLPSSQNMLPVSVLHRVSAMSAVRNTRNLAVRAKRKKAGPVPASEPEDAKTGSTVQLHHGGPQADVFSSVKCWVTFSDLHVTRKTLSTCMEVLRTVHAEARAREAGVLFLGKSGSGNQPTYHIEQMRIITMRETNYTSP
jgi:hypothetical protein